MDQNPYESPKEIGTPKRTGRNIFGLRRKPIWGYFVAIVVGALLGGLLLTPAFAALDDSGGIQMIVGGLLGLVIYGLLF